MANEALKYWFNGLPYANLGGANNASGQKYWFNGLPFSPQDVLFVAVYRRPATTAIAGNWRDNLGGTDLAGALDEVSSDDADYITVINPVSDMCRVTLGGATLDGNKPVEIGYRLGASAGGVVDFVVRLKQSAALITTWTHNDVSAAITLYTQTLTLTERSAIDWNSQDTLALEFEASS